MSCGLHTLKGLTSRRPTALATCSSMFVVVPTMISFGFSYREPRIIYLCDRSHWFVVLFADDFGRLLRQRRRYRASLRDCRRRAAPTVGQRWSLRARRCTSASRPVVCRVHEHDQSIVSYCFPTYTSTDIFSVVHSRRHQQRLQPTQILDLFREPVEVVMQDLKAAGVLAICIACPAVSTAYMTLKDSSYP